MYKALTSFVGMNISARKGQEIEIKDKTFNCVLVYSGPDGWEEYPVSFPCIFIIGIDSPEINHRTINFSITKENKEFQIKVQNSKSKLKLVNTFGSQIRKLINATQFDKGELIFPEIKNDINIFQQSLINIVEDQKNSLFKELGISFNNDDLIIEDPSNFIKELKKDENKFIFEDSEDEVIEINYQNAKDFFIKAFTQNGIPYNLQGILEIENNKFKYNLESTTNKQSIQNLLRGLINRKLINLKINGGQSVLVSSLYISKTLLILPLPNFLFHILQT